MQLRTLESTPYGALHAAFRSAFSDYEVPLDLSTDQLAEMHRRRGVRLDLSVGAFDGDAFAGFTFNGFGRWMGAPAGYDAGTGVAPTARGHGLASRMMERSLDLLRGEGASLYVLEVLQSNSAAIGVYERLGFRVTRELLAWRLDAVRRTKPCHVAIERYDSLDGVPAADMWDWQPSWQNTLASIDRAGEPKTIFAAKRGAEVRGYAVLFSSGDLAQFAVARDDRRRGIGTALLASARAASPSPLRIVNTDAGCAATSRFLASVGSGELVRQYEMTRET